MFWPIEWCNQNRMSLNSSENEQFDIVDLDEVEK